MNVSPFKSATEFLEAEGALYSFADSPGVLFVLTALSAVVMILLVVQAYRIKHD